MNSPNKPSPWESGSEFHWGCLAAKSDKVDSPWSPYEHVLGASGRDVLRLIVRHGMETRGWKRIWVPGYLCQEVVASIVECGIECHLYRDVPGMGTSSPISDIAFGPDDVLFLVNQFGIRSAPELGPIDVDVVEDHTHDPWSSWASNSVAAYCIASLRKTLPIPDGGVLWSGSDQHLPDQPITTNDRQLAALQKLAGMTLKQKYLAGELPSKESFRRSYLAGEEHIADGEISGVSSLSAELISHLDVGPWREQKMANLRLVTTLLSDIDDLVLWDLSSLPAGQVPLSLVVELRSQEKRDQVRASLIAQNIYPAVLWPLESPIADQIQSDELDFSQRCISVHVDARYSEKDIRSIAKAIEYAISDGAVAK